MRYHIMDLSKAFDLVEWASLFKLLYEKGISDIFIRIMILTYSRQSCVVIWNSSYSERLSVSNGVGQGAVSCPKYVGVYKEGLITHHSGIGCKIDLSYY